MHSLSTSQMQVSQINSMAEQYNRRNEQRRTSTATSIIRWLQLKNYQYEVTFSLYMLTSREKLIFNFILLVLVSMMVTAASLYLPNHISIIYKRLWYYVEGSNVTTTLADAVKTTKAALAYQTTAGVARQTTEHVLKEL